MQGLVLDDKGSPLRKGDKVSSLNDEGLRSHLQRLRLGTPGIVVPVMVTTSDYWIIDKPQGFVGHPISLFDTNTITHWAFAEDPELATFFSEIQPTLTPHRLDTGTSGLLIVARHPTVFQQWRERFQGKEIEKQYLAWCWGKPKSNIFEINFSIAHHKANDGVMAIPALGEPYRSPVMPAQTIVKVERVLSDKFLARVICYSGVTHQVRIHLASVGFPLVGDVVYDKEFCRRENRPEWHCLRAVRLQWKQTNYEVPTSDFLAQF